VRNRILSFIFRLLVSLIILVIVFNIVNIREVASLLKKLNVYVLLVAFVLTLLNFIFAGISFKVLLSPFGVKPSLFLMVKYLLYVWAVRNFLPSNIGDLSLVYFLHLEKLSSTNGIVIFFLDKLSSLIVGIILAVPSIYIFSIRFRLTAILPILSITFLVAILLLFFLRRYNLVEKCNFFNPIASKIKMFITTLSFYLKRNALILVLVLFLTFTRWVLSALPVYYIFSYFGYTVSFMKVLSINALIVALSLLPITISGLGIREASAVFFYEKVGLPVDVVFTAFLLSLFIGYLFVCIGAVMFIFERRFTFLQKKALS